MTSFNHCALGAIADWLHRVVAGLSPLEPGYRRSRIEPRPGGRLRWAGASLRTPYGLLSASWRIDRSTFTLEATVPPSTSAEVVLPAGGGRLDVRSGSHRWSVDLPPEVVARWRPSVSTASSIAELRNDPEAWSVLTLRYPDLDRIPAGNQLEHLSVRELLERFGATDTGPVCDGLDADLADLSA
jgi:alpha-L-rhamnosidase